MFLLGQSKGLDPPGTPGWTLNETTDLLLKKNLIIAEKDKFLIDYLSIMI